MHENCLSKKTAELLVEIADPQSRISNTLRFEVDLVYSRDGQATTAETTAGTGQRPVEAFTGCGMVAVIPGEKPAPTRQ
jgi:hypothetical protein